MLEYAGTYYRLSVASDDWEAPEAENDLRKGGKFKTVMAAKAQASTSWDLHCRKRAHAY